MKKNISLIILFVIVIFFIATSTVMAVTLDELIVEATDLLRKWPSGSVKDHMEAKYAGYLTREQVNDIVNYSDDPARHAKPVWLNDEAAAIPYEILTGGYPTSSYSPTGIPGFILSAHGSVSGRIKGMGGVSSALYDDPAVVFHNVSGVVQDSKHSMGFLLDSESFGDAGLSTMKIAGLYSHAFEQLSLGGSFVFIRESYANIDINSSLLSLQFNVGKEFFKGFSSGLKLKLNNYSSHNITQDQSDVGVSVDLGCLYNHDNFISGGLSYQTYNDFGLDNYTLKIPSQLIFGGSIRPIGNLIALLDISYVFWSSLKEAFELYSNTANIHVGVEYNILFKNSGTILNTPYSSIKDSGNVLSFRTGIRTENTPLENRESRTHFTLGAGYKFTKPIQLNLGMDFAKEYSGFSLEVNYQI